MIALLIIESFGSTSTSDDIGIILLLATPVLMVLAFVLFIAGILNKEKKSKIFKIAGITFLAASITALIGLGQCGWY